MDALWLLAPEYVLVAAAFLVFTVDLLLPEGRRHLTALVAAIGAAVTLGVALATGMSLPPNGQLGTVFDVVVVDAYAVFFKVVFLAAVLLLIGTSYHYVRLTLRHPGEFYAILLLATLGMNLLAASIELLTAYIALELMSFSFYVLAGYAKLNPKSNEAAIKYILMGAFSSAILLYGLSYVYGTAQVTFFGGLAAALAPFGTENVGVLFGLILIVAGLGFKVSAVPFHQWAPDVYEGAPIPVTAFLSVASKMAAFALFLRLFVQAFLPILPLWQNLLIALAAASMIVGNLIALRQSNLVRLLAYSSIAQVGYVLVGLAALTPDAGRFVAAGIVFHLVGYAITNLAAFAVIIAVWNVDGKQGIADFAGLSKRAPYAALVMTVALFSLAGLPFFAGFFTKFYLFTAAVAAGQLWLVAFAVLNSFVSLYYYLQVIRQMYAQEPAQPGHLPVPPLLSGVLTVLLAGMIWLGVYPTPVIQLIEGAVGTILR
ncbi:MAG TPA: NADH-quinone oxidoreductase subunit N [Dehalococcoidia bacterium]|nr:NADH-quinone oxidoreductase subunit N [Dehalococcoidia bacterium]